MMQTFAPNQSDATLGVSEHVAGCSDLRRTQFSITDDVMSALNQAFTELNPITTDKAVMGGKPCIRGTRITVETILRRFAEGYTSDDVLADYPILKVTDIKAALAYAAQRVAEPEPAK